MCGICGIMDRTQEPISSEALIAMRDVMLTRGPDSAGVYEAPHIGLGHRRLAIIDLSPAGNNPMPNEDGTVQIVLNGEIYNFQDLRPELEAAGHRFRSLTDTEVLVHGYELWGPEGLLDRIRGMYSFAIWDGRKQRLFIARDRLGKKPMFIFDDGKQVLFASDIKSIWLLKRDHLTIDPKALDEFLFNYYIQQDRSIYKEVWKLGPGEYALFDLDPAHTVRKKYWSISYAHKETKPEDEWLEGIEHHLRAAVRRRLIADVPVGAFLSGGVDSSTVAALMAQESSGAISTFTIGFEGIEQYDERAHARKVADHIGSRHQEIVLQPDVWQILPKLVWHYGEPFGDASAVPSFFVAQAAREFVTVVLTGDGGDEALAGYDRHRSADRDRRLAWIPPALRKTVLPAIGGAVSRAATGSVMADRAGLFTEHLGGRLDLAIRRSWVWRGHQRRRLLSSSLMASLKDWDPAEPQLLALMNTDGPTALDRRLQMDLNTTLPSDYLTKVDVATMAVSLEARCPFLDTDFLEFAATIPADMLLMDGELKHLGKRFAARLVPPEVVYRKKWGFGLPIGHWMRAEWHDPIRRILLTGPATTRGLFDLSYVAQVLEEHRTGQREHRFRIWTLLLWELWQQMFVDGTLGPEDGMPA